MSRIEHPISREDLMAFVDGQLEATQVPNVADHLARCQNCAAVVRDASQLSEQLKAWEVEAAPERVGKIGLAEVPPQDLHDRPAHASHRVWWTSGRVWAYGLSGAFAVILLVFVAAPSLLRSRQASNLMAPPMASSAYQQEGQQGQQDQQGAVPFEAVPSPMMVIRTITLNLVTKEFEAARARIDAIVQQSQGYVDHLTVKADTGPVRRLSATLRRPASQFAIVQLELAEEYRAQLEPPAPSPGTQLRNALVDGIRSAGENGLNMALFVLRYGPVLLIWFIAIGPIIFVLWRRRDRISY